MLFDTVFYMHSWCLWLQVSSYRAPHHTPRTSLPGVTVVINLKAAILVYISIYINIPKSVRCYITSLTIRQQTSQMLTLSIDLVYEG